MIDSILCEVGLWLLVRREFKDCSMNLFLRDWVSCIFSNICSIHVRGGDWDAPMVGKVKVNFDGTSYGCIMKRF